MPTSARKGKLQIETISTKLRNEEIAKNEWKSFGWGLSVIQ